MSFRSSTTGTRTERGVPAVQRGRELHRSPRVRLGVALGRWHYPLVNWRTVSLQCNMEHTVDLFRTRANGFSPLEPFCNSPVTNLSINGLSSRHPNATSSGSGRGAQVVQEARVGLVVGEAFGALRVSVAVGSCQRGAAQDAGGKSS